MQKSGRSNKYRYIYIYIQSKTRNKLCKKARTLHLVVLVAIDGPHGARLFAELHWLGDIHLEHATKVLGVVHIVDCVRRVVGALECDKAETAVLFWVRCVRACVH